MKDFTISSCETEEDKKERYEDFCTIFRMYLACSCKGIAIEQRANNIPSKDLIAAERELNNYIPMTVSISSLFSGVIPVTCSSSSRNPDERPGTGSNGAHTGCFPAVFNVSNAGVAPIETPDTGFHLFQAG